MNQRFVARIRNMDNLLSHLKWIASKKKSCIENTDGTAGAAPAFASVCVSFSNFYASVFSAVLVCVKVTHAFALCM